MIHDKRRMVRTAFYASGSVQIQEQLSPERRRILLIYRKGAGCYPGTCRDFIAKREAPAVIPNDGKQTPMRGHPVFIAQHATATCCRECIRKWHKLQPGRELSAIQQEYLVDVIMTWIEKELEDNINNIINGSEDDIHGKENHT